MRVVRTVELFVSSAFPFLIVLRVGEKKTSAFKNEYRLWENSGGKLPLSGGAA